MKLSTFLIIAVLMFGLPSAEMVAKVGFYSRELNLSDNYEIYFVDRIEYCGDWSGEDNLLLGCHHSFGKIEMVQNFIGFTNSAIGYQMDQSFDKHLIHEIGHSKGLQHGIKLDSYIYWNLLKYQPVFNK